MTNVKELNQANAPLFFAIVRTACCANQDLSKSPQVVEFLKAVAEGSVIFEVSQLLNSSVFKHDLYKANRGPFYNVVKAWLNLAFPFFKEKKLTEEMRVT